MPDVSKFTKQFSIDANDTYILKHGQPDGNRRSVRLIKLTEVSACDGSISVRARPKGSTADFVAIPYEKLHLNGAVADGTLVSTAITDTSLIRVEDSGLELALVCASRTTGSMTVDQWIESDA